MCVKDEVRGIENVGVEQKTLKYLIRCDELTYVDCGVPYLDVQICLQHHVCLSVNGSRWRPAQPNWKV